MEFLAVASRYADISEPAATYLAEEADPALLVPRLATLKNEALRQRMRRGLARRGALPVPELVALLAHEQPEAREEAASLVGTWTGEPRAPLPASDAATLSARAGEGRAAHLLRVGPAPAPKRPPLAPRGSGCCGPARGWASRSWHGGLAPSSRVARPGLRPRCARRPPAHWARWARRRRERSPCSPLKELTAAAEALRAALADPDARVREAAAASLARLAPERAAGGRWR